MNKTIVVCLLTTALLSAVPFGEAQQAKRVPRIGYLSGVDATTARPLVEAYRKGLRDHGYILPISDFRLWSSGLSSENDDSPFEPILAEVGVESESVVESVMVNQGKASAIDEAKVFVVVSHENRLGCLFDCVGNAKDFHAGLIKTRHEPDSRLVTDSEANQSIRLGKDKIGCQKQGL